MCPADADHVAVRAEGSLGSWATAWDELVQSSRRPTPFASSWWIDAMGETGRIVLVVLSGDELIGGLALSCRHLVGMRIYGLLGSDVAAPDHLDLVARPGDEDSVAAAVSSWFASQRRYLIRMEGLPEDSFLAQSLTRRSGGRNIVTIPFTSSPYLRLGGAQVPEPTSSRVRNSVRRTKKRLLRDGLEHRRIDSDRTELDRALGDLLALHRLRWPSGSRFAETFDQLSSVVRAGAEAGRAGIHELVVDDEVVASMLVFDLPDRRCYYQSGRRMDREWSGVGTVLMHAVIEDAHERGMQEFDFLRGREPYKLDWTDDERVLVRLFASSGALGALCCRSLVSFERSKPRLRTLRDRVKALRSSS